MIAVTVVVKVKPEKREEFLQAIRSLSLGREEQPGLRNATLYQEIGDHTGFSLTHDWETEEDCKRYLGAEKFRVLLGALKVLTEKSEIRYGHVFEKFSDVACGIYESISKLQTGSE